ncbi:MAG: MASE1 domain-containing protein [Akkermansiaceae bacterium]|jgi:signal transduction histidine kinase|nr:MASE1 domain-containing protein [Akkermansiaceae bacterium]
MSRRHAQQLAIIGCGALLYALVAWGSLRLAFNQANASAVWPLAGLGIGLLARFGLRHWPIVFLGAFAANFLVSLQGGVALPAAALAALGIALGNTLEALAGARLARHALGDPPEFWSVDCVFRFVILVALLPPLLSAGCGVISLQATGILPSAMAGQTALTWFTGNVAGILTFAPLFFIDSFRTLTWKISRRASAEGLIVLVFLVFVGQAISGMHFAELFPQWPKTYMAIPLVLWIACRFGRRGSVIAVLLLMAIGVVGIMRGYAAFPSESPEQSLLSLQLFISVVAVIGLTVSVLVHQLQLKRKALEAALADKSLRLAAVTQEKAILTASAVHELQSPLSGMRNLLNHVHGTPEVFAGPEGGRLLADMQAAVEHMFNLVSGALTAARPDDAGLLAAVPTACDVSALLGRVVDSEQSHADSKRIAIRRSMPARPVVIPTQGSALEHIVHNFLSNAVKFSKPGATIFLDLEQTEREVTISVTDQGPGIPERDRAVIFSGRIRSNAARPTGGESSTGMGLYLTGELAQRLGAKLTCEATPAGGSVFAVSIPNPAD